MMPYTHTEVVVRSISTYSSRLDWCSIFVLKSYIKLSPKNQDESMFKFVKNWSIWSKYFAAASLEKKPKNSFGTVH